MRRLSNEGIRNEEMILIIAPEDDFHAIVVSERLQDLGHECQIWNTTWFPWKDRISWTPGQHATCKGFDTISFKDVSRIWWRRYRYPTPSPQLTDPHVKRFCDSEAHAFLHGLLSEGIPVTNNPSAERRADSKVIQLRLAHQLGLQIPRTIISNENEAIIKFLTSVPRAICKTLVCDYPHGIETRICTFEDFLDPENVALAPTIVQELVPCAADIRVCIVGERIFAGELVRPHASEEDVDWRMTASGWRPHKLPTNVGRLLRAMLNEFRLEMGSFDLRYTPDERYVFFELNPSGQFLFLEIDAGLRISEAVAETLSNRKDASKAAFK